MMRDSPRWQRLLAAVSLTGLMWLAWPMPGGEPAPEVPAKLAVQRLVDARLKAMQAKDLDAYMALLGNREKEYLVERRNWFLIFQNAPISEFAIAIEGVRVIDPRTIVASLRDTYRFRLEPREVAYEIVLRQTETGWKDCDLNFQNLETEYFLIKFPKEVEDIALTVAKDAERAHRLVTNQLGLRPSGKTLIKLYASRELLRHSTDISVEWLFSGWYESGESIKFYVYPSLRRIAGTIAHELVHKITLDIADSQALWLAEGLAVCFASTLFDGGNPVQAKRCKASDMALPLDWLIGQDLWSRPHAEVQLFYNLSGMVVEFLRTTYGQDKLLVLLKELSKYPRYSRGYDPRTMEVENQRRTVEAIRVVYGLSWQAMDAAWQEWIQKQAI